MDNKDEILIIFVKNPIKGKTKTRLAKTIGHDKALDIYNYLMECTRIISEKTKADKWLFYSEEIVEDVWNNQIFKKIVQEGNDLGDRMQNAFEQALKKAEKVVIIGSDCPTLTTEMIDNSFKVLDKTDLVFGPSEDGGYYLLGAKKLHKCLFNNIEWSTEDVLKTSISHASKEGLTHSLLPYLYDIDTEKDWIRYEEESHK